MSNLYFLSILLPELELEKPCDINFAELKSLLKENLSPADYDKTVVIRRYYDIENLRALWKGERHDLYGNLGAIDLEEAVLRPDVLPPYGIAFLDKYPDKNARMQNFAELIASYYQLESESATGFLKKYLVFERQLRSMQTAYRAKALNRNLDYELRFEDPTDPIIVELLEGASARTPVNQPEFEPLNSIYETFSDKPLELHKKLLEYRFSMIDSLVSDEPFTIDFVLAYLIKLILAEKWHALDFDKGIQLIDSHVKEQK